MPRFQIKQRALLTLACCTCVLFALLSSDAAQADDVFLTKDEALRLVLGTECHITYEKLTLPQALLEKLDDVDAEPEEKPESHSFRCTKNGSVTGYAFIDSQVGKHLPITFIVGISPQGKVTHLEVMVYRELYGAQAREAQFVSQFKDKERTDALKLGKDIRHVSGATLSSKSLTKGVRRNLEIWNYFFGAHEHA